jgi:hypothetical protein
MNLSRAFAVLFFASAASGAVAGSSVEQQITALAAKDYDDRLDVANTGRPRE